MNNGHFLGVPRVVAVDRFDCTLKIVKKSLRQNCKKIPMVEHFDKKIKN
jgi:hypothetical protein